MIVNLTVLPRLLRWLVERSLMAVCAHRHTKHPDPEPPQPDGPPAPPPRPPQAA